MSLYDNRKKYQGMSNAELDAELAAGNVESAVNGLESAVKAVESEAVDKEIELVQLKDTVHLAKANTILNNLNIKYPNRNLTRKEFMYESGYSESKTDDFLVIYGSFNQELIALRIVQDAKDKLREAQNHKRLIDYLTKRYSGFLGVPIEHLEMETQTSYKVVLPMAKKFMGLKPTSVIKFIPFETVASIIMEDMI